MGLLQGLVLSIAALTALPFSDACAAWLETRRPYIAAKTAHEYALNIKTLDKFFEGIRLQDIDADMIRAYQRMRMTKCGPHSINHECSVLQQVLKRVGRWNLIADQYQPLPLPQGKRGQCISDDVRVKLWRIMRANPNWNGARRCATISINTTASPGEAYKLKLRDIEWDARKLWIGRNGAKNAGRIRRNPINDECLDALKEALADAKIRGACEPHHYLFPKRVNGNDYDPEHHQTTFRTAWEKIIKEAVRQGLPVDRLRLEDMRHSANTRLLENEDVSEATYEEMAGHKMPVGRKWYSHIRMERKIEAVDALSAYKKPSLPVDAAPTIPTDNSELAKQLLALAAKLLNSA